MFHLPFLTMARTYIFPFLFFREDLKRKPFAYFPEPGAHLLHLLATSLALPADVGLYFYTLAFSCHAGEGRTQQTSDLLLATLFWLFQQHLMLRLHWELAKFHSQRLAVPGELCSYSRQGCISLSVPAGCHSGESWTWFLFAREEFQSTGHRHVSLPHSEGTLHWGRGSGCFPRQAPNWLVYNLACMFHPTLHLQSEKNSM